VLVRVLSALEGVPPRVAASRAQTLDVRLETPAQLAASKTLATSVRAVPHVRAAVATRGQPYARVDVLSDALSDGSMTMTHTMSQ
jgi:hypothetical protein